MVHATGREPDVFGRAFCRGSQEIRSPVEMRLLTFVLALLRRYLMRNVMPRWFVVSTLMLGSLITISACQNPSDPAQPAYVPSATIKDLMQSVIDPSADIVWEAVAIIETEAGTEDRAPETDEEWAAVRRGAIQLMESANLLLVPGRKVARPGERSEAPGVELEPEEMEVLIEGDRASWNTRAAALHEAALESLAAIDAQDSETLFEVGATIEDSCEGCHAQYWYPNQVLPPGYYETEPAP